MGLLTTTYRTDRVLWESPLDIETAADALCGLGLRGRGRFVATDGPLRGRCAPPNVVATRRSLFNNLWRPLLKGELTPTDHGSRLEVRIRPPLPTTIVFTIWILAAFIGAVAATVTALTDGDPIGLVGWVVPAIGIGISLLGGRLAHGDRDFLRTTVSRAINGTDVSTQGATT